MLTSEFIVQHSESLAEALPQDWEPASLEHLLRIGFKLKMLGINWSSNDQLTEAIDDLHAVGLLLSEQSRGEALFKVNTDFRLDPHGYAIAT